MLKKRFVSTVRSLLKADEHVMIFTTLEDRACNQAVRLVQGAIASAPALGLETLLKHRDDALSRFKLIKDPVKRRLCEVALCMAFKDFFEGGVQIFSDKLEEINEALKEEAAQAEKNERVEAAAEKARKEAQSKPAEVKQDVNPFEKLQAEQKKREGNKPPTAEEMAAAHKAKQDEALARARATLEAKKSKQVEAP